MRVGNLMPRAKDGVFQENILENAFVNRIVSFIKIGAIPDYLNEEYLEFTPIDTISKAIIKICSYPSKNNRIFHLFNHNHVYISKCIKSFKKINPDLEVLSDKEFRKLIKNMLNNKQKRNILKFLMNDMDEDLKLEYKSNIVIKSDFTRKYLFNLGFSWKKVSEDYILKFLELLKGVL